MSSTALKTTTKATKLTLKYPFVIKNLYNSGKPYQRGAGPRTLDSVTSYLPVLKNGNSFVKNTNSSFIKNGHYENTLTNIIVCLSQRDFPLALHQRLLISLVSRGIDLNRIHWVITQAEEIGLYPGIDHLLGPLNENNYTHWISKFTRELNTYLKYFKYDKLSNTDTNIFQTHETEKELLHSLLKDYNVSENNVHFFSTKLPWTISSILRSIEFNPFESSNTYVIGQTNTGKTNLVRGLLKAFDSLSNEEIGDDMAKHLISKPTPFSSKYDVHQYKSITVIDTPGYVRHGGSIWRHLNKRGAFFLHIPDSRNLPDQTIKLTPMIQGNKTNLSDKRTCFSIGGLAFVKPVISLPKSAKINPIDHKLNVQIFRNMPGKVNRLTRKEVDDRMNLPEENRIMDIFKWKKYILEGDEIEVIIDNVGSFKAISTIDIPDRRTFWELNLPQYVRGLAKITKDGETRFESLELIDGSLNSCILSKTMINDQPVHNIL